MSLKTWKKIFIIQGLVLLMGATNAMAQSKSRVGTTTATFLEFGYGGIAAGMGDAYVSVGRDLASTYWNPAGLGYMDKVQVQVMSQPWILGINSSYIGAGYVHPTLGTFALSLFQTGFDEEPVTNLTFQEGTGELFDGSDMCLALSYGRKLAQWFSFGASFKYITSRIWHESGSAVAMDLGAIVNTRFLAWTDRPGDGFNIGMSISNYGSRLRYDGIDLKQLVDIDPDKNGNYAFVLVRFETNGWELPLIARIGGSFYPLITGSHRVLVAFDFLHANNQSESVNVGGQYTFKLPAYGEIELRAGYKGLFLDDSEYGLTFGMGVNLFYMNNRSLKFDYAFRSVGVLGNMQMYTLGFFF